MACLQVLCNRILANTKKLLSKLWCGHAVNIINHTGSIKGGDLALLIEMG